MHRTHLLACTLGLATLLSACSSTGQMNAATHGAAGNGTASTGETVAVADPDPRKCERVLPTGSRIAHRVCMRQSEWDAIRNSSQEATKTYQTRAVTQGNPSGN